MTYDDDDLEPAPQPCWLCSRPLGEEIEWHHPVPKAKGGRIKVAVHPICHQTIHAHVPNSQLGRMGADVEALRAVQPIADFLQWVANKPADFYAPTHKKGRG